MRSYFKGTFRGGDGDPISGGSVIVYLAGTTTVATIYTTLTGTTPATSVTSSTDGTFDFYVSWFDYDMGQQFKISLSKPDFTDQTFDYVSLGDPILTTYTISDDTTVTERLVVPKGVVYSVASGKVLTISGSFEAGQYQVFSGSGTATLSATKDVHPEWWGETSPIIALEDSATPSVAKSNLWLTGGTTTITNFTDGVTGKLITVIAEHSITITDGTNIFLNASANFVMAATDTLTLIQKADGKWYEISRSDNT